MDETKLASTVSPHFNFGKLNASIHSLQEGWLTARPPLSLRDISPTLWWIFPLNPDL